MAVEIKRVASRRELKEFIELPFRLHSTSEQWVPPLRIERHAFLSRRMNAYFKHAEAEYFLARRDGRVVGRMTAQIDSSFNNHHGTREGRFGFLEIEDDIEALRALLDASEAWLRARGMEKMVGPMDFAMNDESGVLIEGYDLAPMLRQPWHPPYYRRLCEEAGLTKAMDLLMWSLDISDRERVLPAIFELAEQAKSKHGVRLRKMTRRGLRADMDRFAEVYNSAWAKNWDFTPYSKEDLDYYAQEMQLVFDTHWMMVAERDGETLAVALTFPDLNPVLRKMNGRVLPFGWWHFLRRGKIMDQVRVGFLGVKPEYQHTGVAALLYAEHFDMAAVRPQTGGEMGWILETNTAMNRGMEAMGGRIVKRYRMYERAVSGGG